MNEISQRDKDQYLIFRKCYITFEMIYIIHIFSGMMSLLQLNDKIKNAVTIHHPKYIVKNATDYSQIKFIIDAQKQSDKIISGIFLHLNCCVGTKEIFLTCFYL